MKKLINILLCTMMSMCLFTQKVRAVDTLRILRVNASFLDETIEVTRRIMEIDSDTSEPVVLHVETGGGSDRKTYVLIQYDGNTQNEIIRTASSEFSFDPSDVNAGLPLYVSVLDNAGQQATTLVNFRIHTGEVSKQIDPEIYSEFGSGITIDLSDKLPGCKFSFLPFTIPVTVKRYADGRIVLGLGYHHADAKFWNDARQGKFPAMDNFETLRDIVLSEENKAMAERPKNVGLLFSISGWAEANVNPKQPVRGKIQLYIGTGVATGGQYAILTWDIVATIGGTGAFDFSLVYNEAESRRNFSFERILVGAIGAVEAFGGIGLYSLASLGIYGAGSLGLNVELLPLQEVDSLILAGEIGFKIKVLGKSILTFTLISGSHDFIDHSNAAGIASLQADPEKIRSYLLDNDYGSSAGESLESGEMVWHGQISEIPPVTNDGWEGDRDFAHLLAEDIYPDSHVQIVNTGSHALPQMNMVFLGSDNTRQAGNRSVLLNSYYNLSTSFMSDPAPIDDNGTADYEPVVYHDPVSGNTYAVWKDAREPISEDMYLVDIASRTEIAFAEFETGRDWNSKAVLTDYRNQLYCAGGADVSADSQGMPVVSYYTTPVGDPLAMSGNHEVWLCTRDELGQWHQTKQFELSGNISAVKNFWFRGAQTIAAAVTDELGVSTVSLWQNGVKIWERTDAGCPQFAFGGNNSRYFLWYENSRFHTMNEAGAETPLTPEELKIPASEYRFEGSLGYGKAVLIGRSASDSKENAMAYISQDGGSTWYQTPLTDIDTHALVDHVSVAFTNEYEPVVIYSVQNYVSNFDESRTLASSYFDENADSGPLQNVQEMRLGNDPRFTDTRCDLYIKARSANTHVSLREGYVKDPDDLVPGADAEFVLSIYNNGMYAVDHVSILCKGEETAQLNETLMPGETQQVPVTMTLPEDSGSEELVYTFEVTSRDSGDIESRLSVTVPGGHLEANADHIFENLQEKMIYSVTNYGYTEKEFEIIVRDEDNNREVSRETLKLKGGTTCNGTAVSPKGMYVKEGCSNVTLYVLFEGEDFDSPSVQPNRICSVIPLEEIYGQPLPAVKPDNSSNQTDETVPVPETVPVNPVIVPDTENIPAKTETVPEEETDQDSQKNPDGQSDEENGGGKDSDEADDTVRKNDDDITQHSEPEETAPDDSRHTSMTFFPWYIPVLIIIIAGVLFWFILGRKRKEEEEE